MTITAAKLYLSNSSYQNSYNYENLEKEFFSMIRMYGKVNRTTWSKRLIDVDEQIEKYVNQSKLSPTQYLDVAVSSGISTWDWYQNLMRSGRPCNMTATDLVINAFLVPIGYGMQVLTDRHGTALQYDFFGYGIRPGQPRPRDTLSGIILISKMMDLAYRLRLRKLGLIIKKGVSHDYSTIFKLQPDIQKIRLVSPRIPEDALINFIEDDLFSPVPEEMRERFDVVRIANLLNHDYFLLNDILTICRRLKKCLAKPNSLFIVCRTRLDNSNHGTIFSLSVNNMLIPVMRIGDGSEIESIVTQA